MGPATWWPQTIGGVRTQSLVAQYYRSDRTDIGMQVNLLWHVQLVASGNRCLTVPCATP
jgi:hypothetical protein